MILFILQHCKHWCTSNEVDNDSNTSKAIPPSRQDRHSKEDDANGAYPAVDIYEQHDGDEPVRGWKRKRNEQEWIRALNKLKQNWGDVYEIKCKD